MKAAKSFIVVALLAVAEAANAQTYVGNLTCKDWVSHGSRESAKTWVLGYISGANAIQAQKSGIDAIEKSRLSVDDVIKLMDGFCKREGEKMELALGASLLFVHISAKAGSK